MKRTIGMPGLGWLLRLPQMVAVALLFNLALPGLTLGARAAEAAGQVRVVAFGDSLTAGYGLAQADAFPVQLERALKAKGIGVEIVNAGVSGDTSGGGLQRLDWAVPPGTQAVILELGANDALRGIDPDLTKQALDKIITRLKARNIAVLVAGMRAPANWGPEYVVRFDALFPELAGRHGALLYPFFLEGVAGKAALNQGDGLHPTAAGIAEIVTRILPSVEKLIEAARSGSAGGTAGGATPASKS